MSSWGDWATGVLEGVGAPVDATNIDTLWGWSNAESGADVMRWLNPLNTTQPWPGAQNMNSVGVKRYASVSDGILATVATLDNGYYPVILANLRASVPRNQWGNACANLGTWGTGCGWITHLYGAAPGGIVIADMTPEQEAKLNWVVATLSQMYYAGAAPNNWPNWDALMTKIAAIGPPGGSGGLTAAQWATIESLAGDVAIVKRLIEKDLAP